MITSTPSRTSRNFMAEVNVEVRDPQLGHDGKNIVIVLPDNECIPVTSDRVREAKVALSKVRSRGPHPHWSAEQKANHDWQLRSATVALREAIHDVMRQYGIEFIDGVPTVKRSRWIAA